jgi:transcription antitermination factor NusG
MPLQDCHAYLGDVPENHWFAFRVRPRHEKAVALQLREKEQEYFLPIVRETRKWANRIKYVDLPLFPGYIFCRTHRSALSPVLRTAGIVDVLRMGPHPAPVGEEEIHALKKAIRANVHIETSTYIDVGEKVYINEGPLTGLDGVVVEVRNVRRLVLSLTILRRSVLAELSPACVIRARQTPSVLEFGQVA